MKRLGAATLTPGAVLLPYQDELLEQLDWLAQGIEEQGGDAWVLPVSELSGAEEAEVVNQINRERTEEYRQLLAEGEAFLAASLQHPGPEDPFQDRLRAERELLALQRRFRKIRGRDHFSAPGRAETARVIDQCLAFRQGISNQLTTQTDVPAGGPGR